ncbi:PIN domain-containing protein [Chitinophaga sp. YIM B06452]|uniref:PIN domain-containing protein n=1 Tax=Chitinophaga sp. YIM B06452 TaxID=3082158 RepID=UPI0031FE8562
MVSAGKVIAVLDANVLYPAPLRDFLLRLAHTGIYIPKWSDDIHDEWMRNLLANRPDLKQAQLSRTRQFMEDAFEDANVKGYKNLIGQLQLPDKDDRHVLAAAIKAEAGIIVTFNKKDFPAKRLRSHDVAVQDPDEFILELLKTNAIKVLEALGALVNALKKPPQDQAQVLTTLENVGLLKSVATIRKLVAN